MARFDPKLFEVGYVPDYRVERAFVNTYSLNMRTGPSTAYKNFRQISRGERVYILDSVGYGWVEIRTARGTGFVQRKFLKK